jgi:hypothetical protein
MRSFRFPVVAMVVAMAFLGVIASSALAVGLPSMLNVKAPQAITGKGIGVIEYQLLSGGILRCEELSLEASLATENTGTFHMAFSKCKSSSPAATCTGKDGTVADAAGVVLWLGTFKIVHDVTETGSTYGVLYELSPDVEFECTALAKVKILGSLLCLFREPTVEKEVHEVACKNNGTVGDPLETKYWFEMKEGTASLLDSLNGGTEETAALVATWTFVTTGSPKAVVMN